MVFTILPILLLLTTLFTPPTITADGDRTAPAVIQKICSPNQTHDPQSFDVNFVDSMEIVSQKVAGDGFGIAVSGDNISDRVYGLGQCFNYLSPIDCRLCYAQSRVKLPLCLPSTSARIYIDGCFLAYGNRNFTGDVIDDSDTSACGSSTNVSNSTEFREMAKGLVQSLTSKALQERNYYKVGNVSLSSGLEVYGMAQCWRSVNRSGCEECLEKAGKSVVGCLPAADGKALNAGCYVRYSTERFYEASLSSSSGGSSVGRRVGIALGCIFVSAVFLGGAIFWMRRGGSSADDMDDNNSEIIKSISESSLSFRYTDLRKATDNFDQRNKLGQGGYGSVYKGILPDGREIAVKRLYMNTRQWVDQFFNEVNLISQVQHKNLVKLLGCSVEGPESLLVYEYLSNTSLDRFLFDSLKKNELDWQRRFDIIVGTAEGLAYLHEASEIRIIHRDIKASNILLDERFKPKIADFGLARYFAEDQTHLSTGLAGTLGYMAPEYVVHGQLTEKADVYSYGIVVLEVITGRKNTSLSTRGEGHSLMSLIWGHYTSKTLMEVFDPYIRGQCSEEQALNVFHVGLLCTQASPNLRPPMWKVVEMLTGKGRDLPLPTQPPFINVKGAESTGDGSEASYIFSSSSKCPVSVNHTSLSIVQGR